MKTRRNIGCAFLLTVAACFPSNTLDDPDSEEGAAVAKSIEEAHAHLTERVMSLPGVVGTAIGECEGKPCIKVYLSERTDELEKEIPATFEGHRVTIAVSGEIRALEK